MVTLCSSAQIKLLVRVRSYNVYRVVAESGSCAFGSWLRLFGRLCPALCRAFSFVRSTGSFSLFWWESDVKESRLSGVSRSHSSNDSHCHQSSSWPRQRRQRWRMWQQLSLEQRCGAILGLGFPQVMTSSVSDSCCPRNLFPSPPHVSSPAGSVCIILPSWLSAGLWYHGSNL